jgi:hypothetical protein
MAELGQGDDGRISGQTDGAMEYGMITYQLRSKAITEKKQAEMLSERPDLYPHETKGDIHSHSFIEGFEYSDNEIFTLTFDNDLYDADDFRKLAAKCIEMAEKIEADKQNDLIVYCF